MNWMIILTSALTGGALGFIACSLLGETSSREKSAIRGCAECEAWVMAERDEQMKNITRPPR